MQPRNYQLVGKGLYTLHEAYRFTKIPTRRIVRWTRGYDYKYKGKVLSSDPIIARELSPVNGKPVLTFLDLIEIRFLDAFRSYGVSWKSIRIAAKRAAEILKHTHPFSTKRFRTEGRSIFADFVDETGDEILVDLVRNQYEFRKIVSPYLYAGLEFNEDQEPMRWWPLGRSAGVVIDPMRSFGSPIVAKVGIPTQVIMSSFKTSDSLETVADWFDIDVRSVDRAITYERSLPN